MTRSPFVVELGRLFRLSVPVALSQLGLMLTNVVDTMMLGHVGVDELGALALGNTCYWAIEIVCLGILMGLDPLVAQAHGRGDEEGGRRVMHRGLVLAVALSLPVMGVMLSSEALLLALGQDPKIAAMAGVYNRWQLAAAPGVLIFTVQRQYLQAKAIMAPATFAVVIANLFNVVANWALIWGHLGLPAMGLRGAALATAATSTMLALSLGLIMRGLGLPLLHGFSRQVFRARGLWQVIAMGAPVGMHMGLEHWAFAGSAMMAGWIGVQAIGSHQVTLNLAAVAFMLPMGLSMGAATRVGNLIGEGDVVGMRRAVRASVVLGAGIMACSALGFIALRAQLAGLYTNDQGIIALSSTILPIVAAFQIADGVQVVATGGLRGMGRPRPGAVVNLICYYAIAYPLAYVLAFELDMQLRGIWIALAVGVSCAAALLLTLCLRTARRELADLTHHVQA